MVRDMSRMVAASLTLVGLFALGCFSGTRAFAQDERVAVFVTEIASKTPDGESEVLQSIGRVFGAEGRAVVAPLTSAPSKPLTKTDLIEVRATGQEALVDLKAGKGDLVAKYEARIARALALTSSVQAGDARALLWNLCVLRVQLLLREAAESLVHNVVRECRRQFVDQYEFGHVWQPEVIEAFKQSSIGIDRVTLGVQSAPAGCQIFLFGAAIGKTPMRIDVQTGAQELQVQCGERVSRVHSIQVIGPRDLVVRLDGDAAIPDTAAPSLATVLEYPTPDSAADAIDHAAALAAEAEAQTFVLVSRVAGHWQLQWGATEGGDVRTGNLDLEISGTAQDAALTTLFRNGSMEKHPQYVRHSAQRSWKDVALGTGLLIGGVAASIYPILAIANAESCSEGCSRVGVSGNATTWSLLGVSTALVASGVTVLWAAPFGRRLQNRADIAIGLGSVHLSGRFQ